MIKVLGIDVGGTHTRWGLVEDEMIGQVHKVKSHGISDYVEFVSDIVRKNPDVDAISMGVPGIVYNHKIINIPNLPVLNVENLAELIETKTGKPTWINRDVRLLFAYDTKQAHIENEDHILAFYLGTGIGNVIKVNGEVIKGAHGFSAELGHIPVHANDKVCGCGKVGCSETLFSGRGLVELFNHHELSGDFKDVFVNHSDSTLIKKYIKGFAEIIAIEMNILDITHIIVGGGVANMNGFPKKELSSLVESHLRSPLLKDDLKIYFVDDSPINSIVGASIIAKEYIK